MFWVPQTAVGTIPAGAGFVTFDSMGQATLQQPMQVVGFLPTFTAGMSNFAGFAQGVAGMVLGSGAANARPGRARRQAKKKQQDQQQQQQQQQKQQQQQQQHQQQEQQTSGALPEAGHESDHEYDIHESVARAASTETSSQDVTMLDKWKAQLEEGGEPRLAAIANIHGSVLDMAMDPLGCHLIQLALDVASQKDAAEMALELRGHICAAIDSKHGNHVVQKVVEVLPTSLTSFVVEELEGHGLEMARHRYGCRILCRLLEHSATEGRTAELVEELVADTRDLSRHAYGYHVMRCILEHGLPRHRNSIAAALSGGVQRHAKHRHASFVVEKALAHCDEEARDFLANEMLQTPEHIVDLARHQFGRHVVSQLVRLPGDCSRKAIYNIHVGLPQVQSSKHGRRLIEQVRPQLALGAMIA